LTPEKRARFTFLGALLYSHTDKINRFID